MVCGCTHEQELHKHQTDSCKVEGCGCCQFILDIEEWKKAKARWDYEDAEDTRILDDMYRQGEAEAEQIREDNEPLSGSTDLGNRGGTEFCY